MNIPMEIHQKILDLVCQKGVFQKRVLGMFMRPMAKAIEMGIILLKDQV
jgi:hypothetical protein